MYCSACGTEIPDSSRFCSHCGAAAGPYESSTKNAPQRPLRRSREDKKIAGVCAGIARYLNIDTTLVRIIMLALALFPPGTGLIIYVVCWIVMPEEPLLLPPAKEYKAA